MATTLTSKYYYGEINGFVTSVTTPTLTTTSNSYYIVVVYDVGATAPTINNNAGITWGAFQSMAGDSTVSISLGYCSSGSSGTLTIGNGSTSYLGVVEITEITGMTSVSLADSSYSYGTTSPRTASLASGTGLTLTITHNLPNNSGSVVTPEAGYTTLINNDDFNSYSGGGYDTWTSAWLPTVDTTPSITFSSTTSGCYLIAQSILGTEVYTGILSVPALTFTQSLQIPAIVQPKLAIGFVGSATGTNTCTVPTHAVGDLIIIFAYRDGSLTTPSLPTGYTNIYSGGANTNSIRVGYRIATSTSDTAGTWTNATSVVCQVYTNVNQTSPIGNGAVGGGTATSVSYTGFSLSTLDTSSWVAGFAGHRSVDTTLETAPSGMTARSTVVDATDEAAGFDTNGAVNTWTTTAVAVGGTASGWRTYTVEILAAVGIPLKLVTFTVAETSGQTTTINRNRAVTTSIIEQVAYTIALDVTTPYVSFNFSITEAESLVPALARQRGEVFTVAETETIAIAAINRARELVETINETETITTDIVRGRNVVPTVNEVETVTSAIDRFRLVDETITEVEIISETLDRNRGVLPTITESETITTSLNRLKMVAYVIDQQETFQDFYLNRLRGADFSINSVEEMQTSFNRARIMITDISESNGFTIDFGRIREQVLNISETQGYEAALNRLLGLVQSISNTTDYTFTLHVYKAPGVATTAVITWQDYVAIPGGFKLVDRCETVNFGYSHNVSVTNPGAEFTINSTLPNASPTIDFIEPIEPSIIVIIPQAVL